jgi:hypothetical protein
MAARPGDGSRSSPIVIDDTQEELNVDEKQSDGSSDSGKVRRTKLLSVKEATGKPPRKVKVLRYAVQAQAHYSPWQESDSSSDTNGEEDSDKEIELDPQAAVQHSPRRESGSPSDDNEDSDTTVESDRKQSPDSPQRESDSPSDQRVKEDSGKEIKPAINSARNRHTWGKKLYGATGKPDMLKVRSPFYRNQGPYPSVFTKTSSDEENGRLASRKLPPNRNFQPSPRRESSSPSDKDDNEDSDTTVESDRKQSPASPRRENDGQESDYTKDSSDDKKGPPHKRQRKDKK